MDNITGEFRNIGEMELLSGRPRRRGGEKGKCERLIIGEKGKLTGFKEKMEMGERGVGSQEFSVEGGVLGLGG